MQRFVGSIPVRDKLNAMKLIFTTSRIKISMWRNRSKYKPTNVPFGLVELGLLIITLRSSIMFVRAMISIKLYSFHVPKQYITICE